MRLFQINLRRLFLIWLPPGFRNTWVRYMLECVAAPLTTLYNTFWNNRQNNLTHIKRNGQVCYLRRMLNEEFPEADGLIRIQDSPVTGAWLYTWDENYDPFQYYLLAGDDTIAWDRGAIIEGASGFTVIAPRSIYNVNNDAKMRSLLNTYKLISKSYTIIYE